MKLLGLLFNSRYKLSVAKMSIDIGGMRKPYKSAEEAFLEKDLVSNEPFGQFKMWFEEACKTDNILEANAMCLATATKQGIPSCRMVLLKSYGKDGFKFYTNYDSRKGSELVCCSAKQQNNAEENPYASLCFYWEPLKRSVRVEGKVQKLSEEESTDYFNSRPKASQIGAVVSDQSKVISSRSVLTEKNELLHSQYADENSKIPKPANWGGFLVVPYAVEFWQGQSNRLHDRIKFSRPITSSDSEWECQRLSP